MMQMSEPLPDQELHRIVENLRATAEHVRREDALAFRIRAELALQELSRPGAAVLPRLGRELLWPQLPSLSPPPAPAADSATAARDPHPPAQPAGNGRPKSRRGTPPLRSPAPRRGRCTTPSSAANRSSLASRRGAGERRIPPR